MKFQYKSGGDTRDGNRMMLKNQAVEFKHHAQELSNAVKKAKHVDAWVVAKAERATTDLSDITHYLDGQSDTYAKGGLMPGGYVLSQLSDTEAIDLANATLKDEVGYAEEMMFNSGYAARRFLREYHSGKADVDEEAVIDRFSQTDDLSDEARAIVEKYRDINHDEDSITEMRDELMAVGYVFDYDDDMIPYSLRRIGEEDDDDGMFGDGGKPKDSYADSLSLQNILNVGDILTNAVGKRLKVYAITPSEYVLLPFGGFPSPWRKDRIHELVKTGEWVLDKFKEKGGMMADGGKNELLPKEELIRILQSVDFQSFSSSDIKEIEYQYGTYNPLDKNFVAKIKAYPCLIDIRKQEGGSYLVRIGKDDGWIGGLFFTATEYVFNIKKFTVQDFEEGLRNAVKNNIVTLYSKYGTGTIDKIYFNGTEQDAEKFALKNGYKKEQIGIMPTGFSYYFINPNLPTYKSEKILYIQRFDDAKVKELGIKNIGNNIQKADGGMMAKGGQIDADEVEKAAKIYADNSNWTVEKLKKEVSEHEDLLENWEAGNIKPSKIIGGGYKSSSVARKLADNWIRRQLAIFRKALELKQQASQKTITQTEENNPQIGDDVRGFNHKYGTTVKDVDTEGRRFKIKQSDYWDSGDIWVSFDDVTQDTDDDRTWHREVMPTIDWKRKAGEIMVGNKIVKLKFIRRCCPSIKSDGSVGNYEYSFLDEQGEPYTGYGNTKEEALKSIEDYLNKASVPNVADDKGSIESEQASIGDSALVVSENKLGTIVSIASGKYLLKFVDGTTKSYNASELKFIKDEDDYPDEETPSAVDSEQEAADARELLELFSEQEINDLIGGLEVLVELGDKNSEDELAKWRRIIALSAANVDAGKNIMRTPSDNISMRERIGNMRLAYNTITGEVFAGGINRKNIIYKDSKGYYVIEGYGTFMKKKYPIKKYFNPNENDVITAFIEGKYASGGMMKKGGITGGYEDLTDMYMSQKIEMLLSKIRPYENYYIDEESNKLYIYFTPEITTEEAEYVMDLLTSSPEFFKGDTATTDYDSQRDRTVVSVEVNRKVEYGKGGATFQDKVNAISGRLEGTEVPRRLRSDYGRRYNKEEAKKAAQRIAGAMRKKGY